MAMISLVPVPLQDPVDDLSLQDSVREGFERVK